MVESFSPASAAEVAALFESCDRCIVPHPSQQTQGCGALWTLTTDETMAFQTEVRRGPGVDGRRARYM